MLMLMRSEGGEAAVNCDDEMIALACQLGTDACPAECKEDANEEKDSDGVVRAGDLAVEADPATDRKILKTWTSDLDTLTFKTSEEVEITKVTLERYGYSTDDSNVITAIWLEDEDGNRIAEDKTLSKDKVTLNIKKDYRKVDGSFKATIVVTTSGAAGTIGFKVTDVESTAKNLNLDNYKPYTYEVVDYKGAEVTVTIKGNAKEYNYEEGESYEVAKLKIKAWGNAVLVKGITLKNASGLDMQKYLDGVTVLADGEEISATATANKSDELVVSFKKDYEIAMNKSATFAVNATFADFDDYGGTLDYYVEKSSSINVIESKNGTRTTVTWDVYDITNNVVAIAHKFAGGKIKLSNKKLGNVDAAQASEGNVVAEWEITITEPISKINFNIATTGDGVEFIDQLSMFVNGDEYEWKKNGTDGSGNVLYKFSNVSIDESGKVQFKLDIKDPAYAITGGKQINFVTPFGRTSFDDGVTHAKYDNSNNNVYATDVAGSISFSKVTIQAAKAALENNLTKDVEFILNETNRKVVFDGTYTARKGAITLNKVAIEGNAKLKDNNDVTFYVYIDGEEVATVDTFTGSNIEESFSNVKVKAGESVKVKVEAEVEAYGSAATAGDSWTVKLWGDDANGNENTGIWTDSTVTMKVKASGSTKIDAWTAKDTVLLKAKNQTIAKFIVKPSNSNDDGITLDKLAFSGVNKLTNQPISGDDIRVKVAGSEYDEDATDALTYYPNEQIPAGWLTVEIVLKSEQAGEFEISNITVNDGWSSSRTFSKRFVNALVYVTAQDNKGDYTKYTVEVDEADDDYTVQNLKFYVNSGSTCTWTDTTPGATCKEVASLANVEDGETLEADNVKDSTQSITAIYFEIKDSSTATWMVIYKSQYEDFFKVWGETLRVFSNK